MQCGTTKARQAVSDDNESNLFKRIVSQYRAIQQKTDFVVCEGTDFAGLASAFEFSFNATLANHLGCPVLIVANGNTKSEAEVVEAALTARQEFRGAGMHDRGHDCESSQRNGHRSGERTAPKCLAI